MLKYDHIKRLSVSCRLRSVRADVINLIKSNPLIVITVSRTKSDNINQMITLADDFYLVIFSKRGVITLSG